MKKRFGAALLALCLLAALTVPALALEESSPAVLTVQALGIMVGDENGNMNLGGNVTRAQYAKILVAASKYRDSISPDGTGYALYRDLKNDHWASEYIRIATQEGWMTGFTDGTFRPENTITLEEVCAATLRLLGYDTASLAGSFPYAHLSKASALGLRNNLNCVRGQAMTRGDCAQFIYNLFSAQTASGQTYGTTIGLTVRDGEVDYITVLMDKLSGPFVASAGTTLSFKPITVFRDGKASTYATLGEYDVYYYNEGLASVWIYTRRVSGKIESVTSTSGTPTAVTVGGKSYTIAGTDAAYRLSALSGTAAGNYVTLLLGMDDKVAGVLSGDEVNGTYYGVVKSAVKSSDGEKAAVQTTLTVFCTDGVTREFTIRKELNYKAGSILMVAITDGGAEARKVESDSVSGRVNADGTAIGNSAFSEQINIIDLGGDGNAVTIAPERLAGILLRDEDVRFASRDTAGNIDNLILNNATGDAKTYAWLSEVSDQGAGLTVSVRYQFLIDGKSTSVQCTGVRYAVEQGGVELQLDDTGGVKELRQLAQLRLSGIDGYRATADGMTYLISEGVQVYLNNNGTLYPTELSAVNETDHTLTGWYDNNSGSAGSRIRIIVAVPKR